MTVALSHQAPPFFGRELKTPSAIRNPLRQFAFRAQTRAKSVDAGRGSPRGGGVQITGGRGLIGVEGPQIFR
jgi:hypothetical protein